MVYVLDVSGNPLTPTKRYGKARHLLETGKAVCVKRCPFYHPADLPECRTETGGVITWRRLRFQAYRTFHLIGRTGILFFRSRTTAGYCCKPFYQKGIPEGQTVPEDALPEAQVFKPDRFQKERLAGAVRQAESRISFESD